ncbi:unnamed protein product [marine sediment metagenome]|uniref:Uncharacterized protein n=1 Tax=marine sediment metagenome TaxID=412755 RepID=X1CRD3_9ZZZZ
MDRSQITTIKHRIYIHEIKVSAARDGALENPSLTMFKPKWLTHFRK